MLTKRENMLEAIRGGNPDRFVNQYEALHMVVVNPVSANSAYPSAPGQTVVDAWGVTHSFVPGTPGPFPVLDDEHKILKDITNWREVVKAPDLIYPEEMWMGMKAKFVDPIDRNEEFVTAFHAVGLFERAHYLMDITDCLMNLYEEPEEMHALLDYLTDWEVRYAEEVCKYYQPDALFFHDDWGTQHSSFMSPAMFEEFFVERYKKIYDTYRKGGVQLIIHHCDSYAANLVPYMIEMGIDIWQGCLTTNDLPALIKEYGSKIAFMGGIDNGAVDHADWTQEKIDEYVSKICTECGNKYFIPCMCAGMPGSANPGVYEAVSAAIAGQ